LTGVVSILFYFKEKSLLHREKEGLAFLFPKIMQYEFNPQDEYLFYPEPLSRENSFDAIFLPAQIKETRKQALYDPNVRRQIAKLKPRRPWFLMTVSAIQIGLVIYSMILNYQQNGEFIETKPNFNYLIGPSIGVCTSYLKYRF
jgi:hypothetical protein